MSKYHHGELKEALIINGIKLLNQYGIDGFSLRKVASACGVSHSAPYKHFKNKEELIEAITLHVKNEFANALRKANETYDHIEDRMIGVGKNYILFMMDYPDYFKYLFSQSNPCHIRIEEGVIQTYDDPVFEVFHQTAIEFFSFYKLPESIYTGNIIAMWSMVQGMATLFASGTMQVSGDIELLIEEMLGTRLKLC